MTISPGIETPGSPPHTRGKVYTLAYDYGEVRITPAHAGKSTYFLAFCYCVRDHPRTRGEKMFSSVLYVLLMGSPPHTRGKVPPADMTISPGRITPAHAGKSACIDWYSGQSWDHPRTRGEKLILCLHLFNIKGSPPHTRGKVVFVSGVTVQRRITPAHAGKSDNATKTKPYNKDHPRTRGEKPKRHLYQDKRQGSPPHTRGKVFSYIVIF